MSREQALQHFELALDSLATARKVGPGEAGKHFAALAQSHALAGVLAVLTEPAPRTTVASEPFLTRSHAPTCSCERCYL